MRIFGAHLHHLVVVTLVTLLVACGGGGGVPDPNADTDADGFANAIDVDDDNDGLIEIDGLAKLDWMRNDLAGTSLNDGAGGADSTGCPANGCNGYELTADLDFDTNGNGATDAGDDYYAAGKGWLPVGSNLAPFTAHFDGNGHHIRNLYIQRPTSDSQTGGGTGIGLFGMIDGTGATGVLQVQNLVLDGPLTKVTGHFLVGTLIGLANGNVAVNNVHGRGKVTSDNSFVGGLVGSFNYKGSSPATACNTCEIGNSSFVGDVVSRRFGTGGLVGITFYTKVYDSFATGNVSARGNVGGLVGNANVGTTIKRSFTASNVGAILRAGALVGKSTRTTYADNRFANDENEFLTRAVGGNITNKGDLDPVGTQGLRRLDLKVATTFPNWGSQWDFGAPGQFPGLVDGQSVRRDPDPVPGPADCSKVVVLNVAPVGVIPGTCVSIIPGKTANCIEERLRAALPDACLASNAFDIFVPGTNQEDGAWKNFNAMFARDTGRAHISLQYTQRVSKFDAAFYLPSMLNGKKSLIRLLDALKDRFPGADIRAFGHSKGSHAVALASEDPAHQDVQFYAFAQAGATEARVRGAVGYIDKVRDNLVTLTWGNDEVKFYSGSGAPEIWGFPGYVNQAGGGGSLPPIRIDHHSNYGGLFIDGLASNDPLQGQGKPDVGLPYCATGNKWQKAKSNPECAEQRESFRPYFWGNADCRNRAFAMMEHGLTGTDRRYIGYSGPRAFGCLDQIGLVPATYELEYKLQPGDQDDCRMHLEINMNGLQFGNPREDGGQIAVSSVTNTGWKTVGTTRAPSPTQSPTIHIPLHAEVFVKAHLTKERTNRKCASAFQSEAFIRRLTVRFRHPDTGESITRTIIGHNEGKEYVYPVKVTGKNNVGWKKWDRPNYTGDTWDLYRAQGALLMEGATDATREGYAYKWVHLLD